MSITPLTVENVFQKTADQIRVMTTEGGSTLKFKSSYNGAGTFALFRRTSDIPKYKTDKILPAYTPTTT